MPIQPVSRRSEPSGTRDAGVAHLIHLTKLGEIAFRDHHGCEDAPEVNFAHPDTMSEIHFKECGTTPRQRYIAGVQQQEAALVYENDLILKRLLWNESDSFRRGRHLNLFPSAEELARYHKLDDQLYFKAKARKEVYKDITNENKRLLDHLVNTNPSTKSAAALNEWYQNVHVKRLQQLSRFRPAEAFSGERVLRSEGVTMPLGKKGRRSGAPLAACEDTRKAGRTPLRFRHAHPSPSYQAFAYAAEVNGKPTYPTAEEEAEAERRCQCRPAGAATAQKPVWEEINARDIPLLHFMSDAILKGSTRMVTKEEENPCTRFWRESSQPHRPHSTPRATRPPPRRQQRAGRRQVHQQPPLQYPPLTLSGPLYRGDASPLEAGNGIRSITEDGQGSRGPATPTARSALTYHTNSSSNVSSHPSSPTQQQPQPPPPVVGVVHAVVPVSSSSPIAAGGLAPPEDADQHPPSPLPPPAGNKALSAAHHHHHHHHQGSAAVDVSSSSSSCGGSGVNIPISRSLSERLNSSRNSALRPMPPAAASDEGVVVHSPMKAEEEETLPESLQQALSSATQQGAGGSHTSGPHSTASSPTQQPQPLSVLGGPSPPPPSLQPLMEALLEEWRSAYELATCADVQYLPL